MIVLRSPKGWTGPKEVDGKRIEGYWRSHQVPFADARSDDGAPQRCSRTWLRSYQPEELFDDDGAPVPEIATLHPAGERRMSATPHANGGTASAGPADARLPRLRRRRRRTRHRCRRVDPGAGHVPARRDGRNMDNFRLFAPDENNSNRLQDVMEVTDRTWNAEIMPYDDHLAPDGRIMEILSEHTCEGWLEGYLLTGRHGLFSCYEAFIHVDRLDVQPARQVAQDHRRHPVAAADRVAELPAHLARVAPGPQRLLPPGPRLHRPRA